MKWLNECSPKYSSDPWSDEEDDNLTMLADNSTSNWDVIANQLETSRTAFQCFDRLHELRKNHKARKLWSEEEDEKLTALVEKYNIRNEINWKKGGFLNFVMFMGFFYWYRRYWRYWYLLCT